MKTFIKKYFIAGIIVLIPAVVTILVLKMLIGWMDGFIYSFIPSRWEPRNLIGYQIPGLGLILTFVIILVAGFFTRLYIGRKFIGLGDAIFARVPFGRAIYQATKQVLHSTLTEEKDKRNRRVVLIEYPKENSYAIGFVSGTWSRTPIAGQKNRKEVTVFVPTTPNPTSGFLLIVPEDSVIPTDMTPEEASKILISGGFLSKKESA